MAITRTYGSKTNQTSEAPAEKKTAEEIILEQRKRTAEILVNAIQNTNLPEWQRGYVFRKQYNPISETRYSKANMIHLMAASLENGWTDPRWVTFPQMKAENQKYIDAGLDPIYVLKKGSKGSLIEFHQECYKDPETGKTIPTNRSSDNTNSNDVSEESRNTFWVHQYYKVFNAEQFEKFPPLERDMEDIVRVEQRNKFIENIMKNSEAPIHFDQVDKNYYIPSKDEIHLVARENWKAPELLYSTALHEIGHSTGHPSRLHRNLKGGKGSDDYAREELVAEFTSALLHGTYNLERAEQENNAAYIKGWSQQLLSDPNAFVYAIRDAEKAVQYIEENMLDKHLKEELYQQYQAEHAPSKDEIELPKSPKDVLSLSLEERKKILENGFGIAIEGTEYPDAHYDKPGTIYLGGASNVFGTTIAELSNANEYTYGSGEKGKIYTGKQLNKLANDLSKDDLLGSIDKRGYYKTYLTYYMKPIYAALDEKNSVNIKLMKIALILAMVS